MLFVIVRYYQCRIDFGPTHSITLYKVGNYEVIFALLSEDNGESPLLMVHHGTKAILSNFSLLGTIEKI